MPSLTKVEGKVESAGPNHRNSRWRTRILLVVAVSLLASLGWLQYFEWARDSGVGPAGPAVDRNAFQNTWTATPVHLLGIGDSITAGLGAKSKERGYFERVLANPPDETPDMAGVCLSSVLPNLSAANLAVSGTESRRHLEIVQELPVTSDAFGLVFMTTGGNDLIHMYGRSPPRECAMYGASWEQAQPWIDRFEARLRTMVAHLTSRFTAGCEIYVADIYDPTDGTGNAASIYLPDWPDGLAIHAEYNRRIRAVANDHDHVFVVPLHETFLGHGSQYRKFWDPHYSSEDPSHWYFENIEDPNDRGYDAIRRIFLNAIVQHSSLRS